MKNARRNETRRAAPRELRNLLASVVESSEDAIYSRSLTGVIISWNKSAERIFGYSAREMIGLSSEILLPSERAYETRWLLDRIRRGQRVDHLQTVRVRKDGARISISLSLSPIHNARGRIVGVSTIARDITAERELQSRLLQASEEERQRIGRDLHDSLGQQLSGMELLGRTLHKALNRRGIPEANTARLLVRQIQNATEQTRAIARGLTPVLDNPNGLMLALEDLATTTRACFRTQCEFNCEEPVLVDDHGAAVHLFRIAQEAVTNAIRHGRARRIAIGLRRSGRQLVLQIEDWGKGMEPSVMRPGLGLRLMAYRASRLEGTVKTSNRSPHGVSIVCRVPLASVTGNQNRQGIADGLI
jgi:PAS domain S-box-containing protein